MIDQYHELRYIETSPGESATFSLFNDDEDRLTLLDYLKENDRIFLLGNPGIGKTTELKTVFKKLWNDRQSNQLVPVFINIKNFKFNSPFESLIDFDDWKQVPAVLFIFDGLDEITNIDAFISELRNFMTHYTDMKLKFIISCRTNIYQKYVIEIPDFTTIYLKTLSSFQIENILKQKYGITASGAEIEEFTTTLQTPFNLDLFANYHSKNGFFPKTIEESFELLFNEGIDGTFTEEDDRIVMKRLLGEVAITNELMQQNTINKNQLEILIGHHYTAYFHCLPFIIEQSSTDSYGFIHKNYQEYYAAKYISLLDSAEIIPFIKAEELDKIRPNLFNTTTYLLNILKGEKLDGLKEWVFRNDIEVLFFADDHILAKDLMNEIFKRYFLEICVYKTYWISNGKISLEILANFANLDFLLLQLQDRNLHFRGRGSALEVLGQKVLLEEQKSKVKEISLSLIQENNDPFTAEILRVVKLQKFHKDPTFLNEVLTIVKDSTNKEICHQLISILTDLEDRERDSELLIALLKRYYSSEDNVIRGTEYLIAHTILNTEDLNLNLELLDLLFGDKYFLRAKTIFFDNFESKLKERIKALSEDPGYLLKFAEIAFGGQHRLMSNPLLANTIAEIGLTPELALHVLRKQDMSRDVLYNISGYLNPECIDAIIESYKNGSLQFKSPEDIVSFRNWLSNHNLQLALYLEQKFEDLEFTFPKPLVTQQQINEKRQEYANFSLRNFRLLFDQEGLISEIDKYFKDNNLTSLTKSEFQPLFFKWYDDTNFHGIQYIVHTVLETIFRLYPSVSVDQPKIADFLNDPYIFLSVIRSGLSHSSSNTHTIEEEHINQISLLTKELAEKLDFNNVLKINPVDSNRFGTTVNFSYLKLLLFFDIEYNMTHDKEFYLNALEFGYAGQPSKNAEGSFIDHASKRINDDLAINNRVVNNINNAKLNFFSKEEHISYAIDHNLAESFTKIKAEILSDQALSLQNNIVVNFVDKISDGDRLTFLKSCCMEPDTYLYWFAIKLIKERKMDDEFILNAAIQYLERDDFNFIDDALNILFYLNQPNALLNYNKTLRRVISNRPDTSGLFPKDTIKYTQMVELYLFEDLFHLIYEQSIFKGFYLYQSRNFMNVITANLSSNEDGYEQIKNVLSEIRNNLMDRGDQEDVEHKTFYINSLNDAAYNSYLKSRSTAFSFEDVCKLLGK